MEKQKILLITRDNGSLLRIAVFCNFLYILQSIFRHKLLNLPLLGLIKFQANPGISTLTRC